MGLSDILAAAALIVAVCGLIWTIRQDKSLDDHNARLRGFEERRETRESAPIVGGTPPRLPRVLAWPG